MERFDYAIILCSFQIDFRWPEMTRPSSQKSAPWEWDTRSFLGVPSAISSFFDIEGRRFSTRRWRLPSRAAQWEAALMRKLAKILEQSSGMRQVFFFFCSLYKTTRFHVAVGLFSYTSRKTSNCGQKNYLWKRHHAVTHPPCFYHILKSSGIYYWTDVRQHGIYLLKEYFTPPVYGKESLKTIRR